jgi:AraC-like DNA-binding protein
MTGLIAALGRRPGGPAQVDHLRLCWLLCIGGLGCFLLRGLIGGGPVALALDLASAGTCGLSWLLARALFRPGTDRALWPRVVVGSLFASAILMEVIAAAPQGEAAQLVRRVLGNINMLVSSTVLLLGMVEAFDGYKASAAGEKRFRLVFASLYGGLVFTAVILLRQSGLGEGAILLVKDVCAGLAAVGATAAVAWRILHPMPAAAPDAARKPRKMVAPDAVLAQKISGLMQAERVFTRHDVKVADIARLAGEPEYKITQAITGPMGFANFNRLVNHYRIELAKEMLADPAMHRLPILTIALDCGFASIGPFNRAFKEAVEMTPSAWRETRTREAA